MKPSKLDLALIFIALFLAAAISLGAKAILPAAASVDIYSRGQLYRSLPLTSVETLKVTGKLGEIVVQIKNGQVAILTTSCPQQLCKHMGPIKTAGEALICLPNEVVIKIDGQNARLDATTM